MFVRFVLSVADVGKKRNDSRALDRIGQLTLVSGAGARNSAGQDLGALGDVLSQSVDVLVVNVINLFRAELADFSSLAAVRRTEGLCGRLPSCCPFSFPFVSL